MKKLRLWLVKHRRAIKGYKILIFSGIAVFSYFINFHYSLIAPAMAVMIYIELNKR